MRGVCLAAALLFALGVFSGVVVRSQDHAHHRHGSALAAVTVTDGQDGVVRSAQSAVLTPVPKGSTLRASTVASAETSRSADQARIDVARQRGPPEIIA